MLLSDNHADTIAALLKARNQLTREYNRVEIQSADYLCRFVDDEVVAFVEIRKVQWYQMEVCHLTVALAHEGRGHAKSLIKEAEERARQANARILQCTIRDENVASLELFKHFDFQVVSAFHNRLSRNNVYVLQKVLEPMRLNTGI